MASRSAISVWFLKTSTPPSNSGGTSAYSNIVNATTSGGGGGGAACTTTGTPQSQWDINGAGSSAIQGFATDISVNRGQAIFFKVKTTAQELGVTYMTAPSIPPAGPDDIIELVKL